VARATQDKAHLATGCRRGFRGLMVFGLLETYQCGTIPVVVRGGNGGGLRPVADGQQAAGGRRWRGPPTDDQ
jgi:hypothetical protein